MVMKRPLQGGITHKPDSGGGHGRIGGRHGIVGSCQARRSYG